ncbi:FAD-dependent oxidoreductase [Candidatus Woesearchaeota archaeon]|nr:FAD-dependent oxidoreductase [Candidatus Woesearchaeota archaeon]
MKMNYDIIVIGAGSGGLNIAGFMNKAGFKVLLIDKKDENIGGDCLNFGCVPSKALIHVSKLVHSGKEAEKFGLETSGKVSLRKVMDYVRSKKEVIREHENASYFKKIGMDVELGLAKFSGKNSVTVNGNKYTAKKIVLATGSRPRKLSVKGVENVRYQTNETIFDLEELPEKLLVIGGGPIGVELSQAFSRLGSKVTILIRGDKFLPKESEEMALVLYEQLVKEGIDIKFDTSVKEFLSSNEAILSCEDKEENIDFDEVLVSIGRDLNVEGLDLANAGIEFDRKIKVDEYLRTTNKDVLLCGDIAGGYQFTHAAELHASVIISNFFSPFKKKLSYSKFSWVTYTDPEIATFGFNEEQLKGKKYEKLVLDFEHDDRSIVDDFVNGKTILFVSKNKILGGSMVAKNAGEIAQELILANSSGLSVKNIFNKIYPYPVASRVNKKIISDSFSKKLNERTKKILKWLY